MPEVRTVLFRHYLQAIRDKLGQLTSDQWREIEYELWAHLADAAADEREQIDDPAFQARVIEQLGRSTEMARAFHQAYDRRSRLFVIAASLMALVAGLSTALTAAVMLVREYSERTYTTAALSTERWMGRWDENLQTMVWSLEQGPSGLPNPALFILSTCMVGLIGALLLASAWYYRRGRSFGYRLMQITIVVLLLAVFLFQGFDGHRVLYIQYALIGLLGLFCAWVAERHQFKVGPTQGNAA